LLSSSLKLIKTPNKSAQTKNMGNCCRGSANIRTIDPQQISPANPSVVSEEEKIDIVCKNN